MIWVTNERSSAVLHQAGSLGVCGGGERGRDGDGDAPGGTA